PLEHRRERALSLQDPEAGPSSRGARKAPGAAHRRQRFHARPAEAARDAHLLSRRALQRSRSGAGPRARLPAPHLDCQENAIEVAAVEHRPAGQGRDRLLRLLAMDKAPQVRLHSTSHYFLEGLNEIGIDYLFGNLGTDHAPLIEEMARWKKHGLRHPPTILCPH